MCAFRKISKIRFLGSGEEIDVSVSTLTISAADMGSVTEPGFYSVVASGSFHAYFDGKEWLQEYTPYRGNGEYEVIDFADCSCGGLIKLEKIEGEIGDWNK